MSGAAATSTSAVGTGRRRGSAPEEPVELDAATALIQLSRIVQCVHADLSEQHGLTPVQAKLLCVLATSPRQMAELARGFGVEKAALTGLVDRAERRGLVRRSPVTGDRRAVAVTLTDAGRAAAHAFHQEATAQLDRLLAALPRDEREAFRRAMTQVIAAAEATAHGDDVRAKQGA